MKKTQLLKVSIPEDFLSKMNQGTQLLTMHIPVAQDMEKITQDVQKITQDVQTPK